MKNIDKQWIKELFISCVVCEVDLITRPLLSVATVKKQEMPQEAMPGLVSGNRCKRGVKTIMFMVTF